MQGATLADVAEGNEDIFGLSTDSLSHLRSPSVLEVREKGYERLKEELAKAQRVRLFVLSLSAFSLFKVVLMLQNGGWARRCSLSLLISYRTMI